MNYKSILTEEAVVQFRKEGATAVTVTLMNEGNMIRSLFVDLTNPDLSFCISGRTPEAQGKLQATFSGRRIGNKCWYPFIYKGELTAAALEAKLKAVAEALKVPSAYLEYSFLTNEELDISEVTS